MLVWGAVLGGTALPVWAASQEAQRLNDAAAARTAQGKYEEAAALFTQALRLSPGDEVVQRNLARLRTVMGHRFLQAGSFQQAREQYQAALELDPNETAALLGLGDVLLRQRDPRAAAERFRRAIGLEPRNPDAYARLGEAYYNLGDLQAALSEWERGLALRPGDARLTQRLEEVRPEAERQRGYRSQDSQHFRVLYEGQRREDLGRELLRILEHAYTDVGYALGAYPPYEVQAIFYAEADFQPATGLSANTLGFYHALDGKIRVALRGLNPGDPMLGSVLYHEYTHALVYAITRGRTPPRWMDEGLAVAMEQGRAAEFKQEAIRQARVGVVPPLEASPYIHGSVAVEYLITRYGMSRIRHLLTRLGEGARFGEGFQEAFQTDLTRFQQDLRALLVRGD